MCMQISSVHCSPLTDWVVRGDMRDDSAEILFQSFLQKALVSSSGLGKDVHSFAGNKINNYRLSAVEGSN